MTTETDGDTVEVFTAVSILPNWQISTLLNLLTVQILEQTTSIRAGCQLSAFDSNS